MNDQQQAIEIARVLDIEIVDHKHGPCVSIGAPEGNAFYLRSFEPHSDWRDIGLMIERLVNNGWIYVIDEDGVTVASKKDSIHSDKPADQGGVAEVFCKVYGICDLPDMAAAYPMVMAIG